MSHVPTGLACAVRRACRLRPSASAYAISGPAHASDGMPWSCWPRSSRAAEISAVMNVSCGVCTPRPPTARRCTSRRVATSSRRPSHTSATALPSPCSHHPHHAGGTLSPHTALLMGRHQLHTHQPPFILARSSGVRARSSSAQPAIQHRLPSGRTSRGRRTHTEHRSTCGAIAMTTMHVATADDGNV